jgi:hypothetical protein
MKCHLSAGLILVVSLPILLAATGSAAGSATAVSPPDGPPHTALVQTIADPTPSVSPSPLPSPSPSPSVSPSPSTESASPPTDPNPLSQAPRTNLTAVVDPIAVPVRYGVQVRVGVRNSGPRSITAPDGQAAASLSLIFQHCCLLMPGVRSLSSCPIGYIYPPSYPWMPALPIRFDCSSPKSTLLAGDTYWESFVFPIIPRSPDPETVSVNVSGYAQDTDLSDNSRTVVVRLANPGSSLPVTGPRTISVAGTGLALLVAGTVSIWYGRRRRLTQPTDADPTITDETTS